MLLVHWKVLIDAEALPWSHSLPFDIPHYTTQRLTTTGGIHFTKINDFSIHNHLELVYCSTPVIQLEHSECHSD
jgi:hypothetical protein